MTPFLSPAPRKLNLPALIRAQDWDQLIAGLEPEFRAAPAAQGRRPAEALAMALRNTGRLEAALEVCEAALAQGHDSQRLLSTCADALFLLGRKEAALVRFEQLFARHERAFRRDSQKRYYHLLRQLPPEQARSSRRRATGPLSALTQAAFDLLEARRGAEARTAFDQALGKLFEAEVTRANWRAAFAALQTMLDPSETAPDVASEAPAKAPDVSAPPVLAVSGMGWSGSGAIFDYLREFETVIPTTGEFPILQGRHGLADLARARGQAGFAAELLGFFRDHFLGFTAMPEEARAKSLAYAKQTFCGPGQEAGSALARAVFEGLAAEFDGITLPTPTLQTAIEHYMLHKAGMDRAGLDGVGVDGALLFDNIIHAYNLDALAFTRNITLFVCFRDPRSNYVSRLAEDSKPMGPVGQFITAYRKNRKLIDRKLKAANPAPDLRNVGLSGGAPSGVRLVQFEPFVLSREYRLDLARAAGLDPTRQREYSRFQPEVSRKNVFNFRTHPDQEAIRRIEAELGEYCLDLDSLERQHPPDRA